MCDTLQKEVKVTYTGQIQHESGVDQVIRKTFRISESGSDFLNFN